ncbi:MFS transporter [Sphingosinicella soli]|uniref:Putative MFS family arabinose efflux permease n=1 Tax=Sphingosinicella soli TaxID=333708 RepID=A0A7W7F720_9SPHN|nr:MFS transporter [Sphingosinicella soli]MBB4633155.1 putative MFS family arabinose efflux permease [Sphingosinicella soli]
MNAEDHALPVEASTSNLLAGWRDEPTILLSNFAANAIAYLPALTLPWTIGALMEHQGLSGSMAGLIASAELGCIAAVTALCGTFIDRFDRLRVVILGAVLSLIATLMLAVMPGEALFVAMPLSGVGFGICCAAGNAITASSRDPARLSARSWILMMPWQMLIWAAAPWIGAHGAVSGLFALQAAAVGVMLLLLIAVRHASTATGPARVLTRLKDRPRLAAFPLVLIILCTVAFWLRDATTWSLVERRATALDVDGATLSAVLSIGTVIGLAGPAATIWLGLRFGRLWTVVGSQILVGLVFMAIALVASPVLYCVAFLFWSGTSIFAWTYIIEMTIALDASGRTTAICSGLVFGAGAFGPLIGGLILDSGSVSALPVVIGCLSVATIGFAQAVARRISAPSVPQAE